MRPFIPVITPSIRIRFLLFLITVLLTLSPANANDKLLQQAQDELALGYYREAEQQLQQLAKQPQNDYTATLTQGLQGLLALHKQQYDTAEQLLNSALSHAQQRSWHDLTARFSLYLARLHQQQTLPTQVQQDVALALTESQQLSDKSLLVSSLIDAAKLATANKQYTQAWTQLQQTKPLLAGLPVNSNSSQLWLSSGYQLLQLYLAQPQQDYLTATFYQLNKALEQAKQTGQKRIQAAALKHLATLYQQQKNDVDAEKLLLSAIQLAQQDHAQDRLVGLEWQLGQLYKNKKQPQAAIAAYKRAVQHLEATRLDIPVSYEKGRSSFKSTFEPLYLGLVDLLLQQAPLTTNKTQQQTLLHQAQNVLELMKKSELEDYFQSRCILPATTSLDLESVTPPLDLKKVDPHAAAIYPIPLADRLEIIVYTADGLHQFTQPITGNSIEEKAKLFANQLRDYVEFDESEQQHSKFLYHALIDPIQALLKQQHIETLIYVPDGVLRLLPLGVLYDGNKFLIEDYAVVTSAGLSLIARDTSEQNYQNILFAGMSTPGLVINELKQLENESSNNLNENESTQKTRAAQELLERTIIVDSLQDALALPDVTTEIKQLATQSDMPYLLNEDFSLGNFSKLLNENYYKIIHIASHGYFGASTEKSFIMTHDKILTMNKLEELFNTGHFKNSPPDLIILSACKTAKGDDRSPLGISGVAIKAKVHSTIGSLWSVSDAATAQLMENFYTALKKPHYSKAKALQEAEINLLKFLKQEEHINNPSLWSPFILVGNWW